MAWFRAWIESNFVFVSGGIEVDLFLEWGSKLLAVSVRVEINLAFVGGSKLNRF